MNLNRLVIASPSGNITGIVFDDIDVKRHASVAVALQEEYPSIEQVLFVQKHGETYHGQMAGGEFCGNAARALGYILADGKTSLQTFTMSGTSAPVSVEVEKNQALLTLETSIYKAMMPLEETATPVIHMEGISHVLMLPNHPLFFTLKERAEKLSGTSVIESVIQGLGLKTLPACGVIFVDNQNGKTEITPYVFVRDTNTICAETSCVSGSIATAYLLSDNIDVLQPNKKLLHVRLKHSTKAVTAVVGGDMAILWDGVAQDLNPKPIRIPRLQPRQLNAA